MKPMHVFEQAKFSILKCELLEHPAYMTDLASSDYYLLPNPKLFLAGMRFTWNNEAIAAMDGYFPEFYFNNCIELLKNHCNKCIEILEDYIKKWNIFHVKKNSFIVRLSTFQTALVIQVRQANRINRFSLNFADGLNPESLFKSDQACYMMKVQRIKEIFSEMFYIFALWSN